MKHRVWMLLLCAAFVPLALFSGGLRAAPQAQSIHLRLYPMRGSTERGTATLTQRGTSLVVSISVTGAPRAAAAQYVHLHRGTCEHVASPAVYELQPIRDGRSTSRLEGVGLETLIHGTYSILVHQSLAHTSAHVACGTITGA